jgi:hypothetical protein
VYDYITKLIREQAEIILNRVNPDIYVIGQGEIRHKKCMRLKLTICQAYNSTADYLQFQSSYIS